MTQDVRDLIAEARKYAPGDDPTGLAVMVHRLADALEAATRVPVQGEPNDDRCLGCGSAEEDGHDDCTVTIRTIRATVPDAATEAKQPAGWSNEDAHAAADQAFARWSTHDERDVWNRNGFRLGAEWQKARETFISFKAIADESRAERDAALAAIERCRGVIASWKSVQASNREQFESGNPGMIVPIDFVGGLSAALDGAPEPAVGP